MEHRKKKRNTPVVTLIRNYKDKKSGKVTVSREEIQWRFKCLDWKDQKIILVAFLNSGKVDREWAYSQLLDNWDDSFMPLIIELWETYHETKCSWLVIRYSPLEYVKKHMNEFDGERDYFFICLRLAMDVNYIINRSMLSKRDYLAVVYHTGRNITDNEAHDILFGIIHDCCVPDYYVIGLENVGVGKINDMITPANFREVNLAVYYLKKLNKNRVVGLFDVWIQIVKGAIINSSEFKSVNRSDYSDYGYEQIRIELAKFYAYQALDSKFKLLSDPTADQMLQSLELRLKYSKKQQNV